MNGFGRGPAPGPQFFQTGYGKRFFDGQLPALIKALERIAKALEPQNESLPKVTYIDVDAPVQERRSGSFLQFGDYARSLTSGPMTMALVVDDEHRNVCWSQPGNLIFTEGDGDVND